jgi:hypothetical protein
VTGRLHGTSDSPCLLDRRIVSHADACADNNERFAFICTDIATRDYRTSDTDCDRCRNADSQTVMVVAVLDSIVAGLAVPAIHDRPAIDAI